MVRYIDEEDYFQLDAMNQSLLKSYSLKDPRLISKDRPQSDLFFEEKGHFVIGTAVDCILTQGIEKFKNTHHVSQLSKKPTDVQKSIINEVFVKLDENDLLDTTKDLTDEVCKIYLLNSFKSHEYYDNIKDPDKRIAKISENFICKEYFLELKEAKGKVILSQEEYDKIYTIVDSLMSYETTGKFFRINQPEGIKIFNQFGILFEHNNIPCKALLDFIVVDEINKTITPVDLKTTFKPTHDFDRAVRERRYDIQAAWYTLALEKFIKVTPEYMGYKILPFQFIVESSSNPGLPILFTCDQQLLRIGRYGVVDDFVGDIECVNTSIFKHKILGFEELLKLYIHYENLGYKETPEYASRQGKYTLGWLNIY